MAHVVIQTTGILKKYARLYCKAFSTVVRSSDIRQSIVNYQERRILETLTVKVDGYEISMLVPNSRELALDILTDEYRYKQQADSRRVQSKLTPCSIKDTIVNLAAGQRPLKIYTTKNSISHMRYLTQHYADMLAETKVYLLDESSFYGWFPMNESFAGIFSSEEAVTVAVQPEKKCSITVILDKVHHGPSKRDFINIAEHYNGKILFMNAVKGHYPCMERNVHCLHWGKVESFLPNQQRSTIIAIGTNQEKEKRRYCTDTAQPSKTKAMQLLVEQPENVSFSSPDCVIVLSGKIGLSTPARQYVFNNNGIAVETPLYPTNPPMSQCYDFSKVLEVFEKVIISASKANEKKITQQFDFY